MLKEQLKKQYIGLRRNVFIKIFVLLVFFLKATLG
jgi:hypothetical protein